MVLAKRSNLDVYKFPSREQRQLFLIEAMFEKDRQGF